MILLGKNIKFSSNSHKIAILYIITRTKGHFTHESESLWPLHFKHSHWWKRPSWSKFTSHYAWGTNKVCGCKMDVKSAWVLHEWVVYYVWEPTWIEIRWNSIWLTVGWHHTIRFWRCIWAAFGHFLWGSHSHGSWLMCEVALIEIVSVTLTRATSHTSQEPWPWNCESPKESV
jgi:hypothetical protein